MGNLIKDFWTYQYNGKQYYGICEVVAGEDLQQSRHIKKYETHIDKALQYTMQNQCLSHISIQKYLTYLKDSPRRSEDDETFYPFFMEFESKYQNQYEEAVSQALRTVLYFVYELQLDERDILILVNNSRSIYVMINPVSYGLRPSKDLYKIYREMYDMLSQDLALDYVDTSLYSMYSLMKTPNCYYKGGYFVQISLDELRKLASKPHIRKDLTAERRSLDILVPGKEAEGFKRLYMEAKERIHEQKAEYAKAKSSGSRLTYLTKCRCCCVEQIEKQTIEPGCRNHALVSVAIYYKNNGYTEEQVMDKLLELSDKWDHDEGIGAIRAKVRSIFRSGMNFSCEKARDVLTNLDMDVLCSNCPYNQKNLFRNNTMPVSADLVNSLWNSNAGTRHYVAYLTLLYYGLFNKDFDPAAFGLSNRILRELCRYVKQLSWSKSKGMARIGYDIPVKGIYYIPKSFMDDKTDELLGDYIKHYLKLLIKGYKPYNKYMMARVSIEKIQKDLGYKDISGVYKLIRKLEKLGLLIKKKKHTILLYYKPYNVVAMNDYLKEKSYGLPEPRIAAVNEGLSSLPSETSFNSRRRDKTGPPRGSPPGG